MMFATVLALVVATNPLVTPRSFAAPAGRAAAAAGAGTAARTAPTWFAASRTGASPKTPTPPSPPPAVAAPRPMTSGPISSPPMAKPLGLYFRAGALHLHPMPQSGPVVLSNVSGPALLAIDNGPVDGSGAAVDNATIPELTVGYRVWRQLSVETILAAPITLKLLARGTLASESLAPTALGLPTGVPALGGELGETTILPPIVTARWTFLDGSVARPYVGAGINVLFSYNARITNPVLTEVTQPRVSIPIAIGWVAQAGVDFKLWEQLHLTIDGKYIAGLEVTATMRDLYVRLPGLPIYDAVHVGDATVRLAVNPWLLTAGLGWNF